MMMKIDFEIIKSAEIANFAYIYYFQKY